MSDCPKYPQQRGRGRGRAKISNLPVSKAPQQTFVNNVTVKDVDNISNDVDNISLEYRKAEGIEKPLGRGTVRLSAESDSKTLITRPATCSSKKGDVGENIRLQSNFFEMEVNTMWRVYKHHVDFDPAEDRTFVRKALMKEHSDMFKGYLFDGSTLFLTSNLCPHGKPLELVSTDRNGNKVSITIKSVGTVEAGDHQYLQIFNIVMRECMSSMKLELIRRNYFDPHAMIKIPEHSLEIWPGYVTSVTRCEENKVLLQVEVCCKVLRRDTAYQILKNVFRGGGDVKTAYSNAVMGTVVMTTYNTKTYRIDEVDWDATPNSTFEVKKGGNVSSCSYASYYETRYNAKIHDMKQPMLVSRSSAKDRRAGAPELVYLVPELCTMTGLTDEMRSNFPLMKAVAVHTSVAPSERINRLLTFSRRINETQEAKKKLASWGMCLAPKIIDIPGRRLPTESIVVGGQNMYESGMDADWTRSLRNNPMLLTMKLDRWVIIYPSRIDQEVEEFVKLLIRCACQMQFEIKMPKIHPMPDDRSTSYCQTLDKAINIDNPQMAMCVVMTNKSSDRYSAIKKKCIVDKPVASQVVTARTLKNKGIMSIAMKIAIQLNCKLGGAAWGVQIPTSELMVVGFDVCHDPKDKRRSYGAMVATLDKDCTRYFSCISNHSAGEQLSTNFGVNISKAVIRYRDLHNKLPGRIVVFRDGVGEGNLEYVHRTEVKSIQAALDDVYESAGQKLKMCFIIVTKRINTRIFFGDRNPLPGTVVDDVITSPYRYDFFLISQSVRLGTVAPTHYNVLEDTTGWMPNHIQRLTYKFTHLYYNWSGTVRVPAPCQYAHKLAFLTSQSVGVAHSTALDSSLYYL